MEQYANEGPCTVETSRSLCTVEKRAGKTNSVLQPATPDFLCQGSDLTKSNDAGGVSISNEKAVHKHTGAGTLSKANANTNHRFFMEDDAAVQAAADERVPAKNAILHRRQRKLLNLHARLDEQQARERTAINTLQGQLANLQGQLAKLKSMASQLEISIGKHVSSAHATTVSSSSDIGAAVSLSASSGCYQFDASANAYVVPHKFSEMPQSYSLHNLNTQSVIRADGTKHSYFTLSEDYSLERDFPEPVFDVYHSDGCSNEFVHVFSSTPEQQSYEEEEQDSEQLLKRVGKAPKTEQTSACLNYISAVFGFTSELQEQDDERAGNCSVLKASNSFVSRSSLLSIEHSMRERRLLWDPGASASLHSSKDSDIKIRWQDISSMLALPLEIGRKLQWDPGDTNFLQSLCATTAVQVTNCMHYIASTGINPVLHATVFIMQSDAHLSQGNYMCYLYCNSVLKTEYCREFSMKLYFWIATRLKWDPRVHVVLHSYTATRPGTFAHVLQPIFASAISCSYAFALGWTEVNIQQLRDPSLKLLVTHESRKEYAYTVGFLNGQCKYIHQRGVQENHNAKQLLISSKNYLHIWEIDILFITFLPP